LEKEIPILRPVGNNLPYDFVIEYEGALRKVQVKTGRKAAYEGSYIFNTRSTSKNFNEVVQKTYEGKIDYFAVQFRDHSREFYLIPVGDTGTNATTLYLGDNPRPGQNVGSKYKF
jgi:hypothetical protein